MNRRQEEIQKQAVDIWEDVMRLRARVVALQMDGMKQLEETGKCDTVVQKICNIKRQLIRHYATILRLRGYFMESSLDTDFEGVEVPDSLPKEFL